MDTLNPRSGERSYSRPLCFTPVAETRWNQSGSFWKASRLRRLCRWLPLRRIIR